jgi:hypothetical protein
MLLLRPYAVPVCNVNIEFRQSCYHLMRLKRVQHAEKSTGLQTRTKEHHSLSVCLSVCLYKYSYYVVEHYPSSCLYLKTVLLIFKTQRFGD